MVFLKKSGQDEKHTKIFLSFEICISRLVKGQLSPHRDCLSRSQMILKPVKHQQGRAAQYNLNLHYSSDGTSDISVGCFHLCKLQSCHLDSIHLLCIYTTQTQILLGTDYFVMKKDPSVLIHLKDTRALLQLHSSMLEVLSEVTYCVNTHINKHSKKKRVYW